MAEIREAQLVAFYLFDVAETIDLSAIPALVAGPALRARLTPKPATPAYVQYDKPPLSFDGEAVAAPEIRGFRARIRVYDYGVISIGWFKPFAGSWSELAAIGQTMIESDEFERRTEALCRTIVDRLRPALAGYRDAFLSEDYLVYAITALDRRLSADELIEARGASIAAMLRGEAEALSRQETTKILGHRISYLADDVVIPTWNAALVYDTPVGTQAALEILEFANSQLLEFRYYDGLLDDQLESIYGRLQHPRWYEAWVGARYASAARQVHSLVIDVNELTDRTENAIKFIGDMYAARLFGLVADRLGLGTWKANVQAKLKTLDDIYGFAVEQSSMARGQFLELTVVLILVLELLLVFMGVMK